MALVYRVSANFCSLLSTAYCKCTVNIIRYRSKKHFNEQLKNSESILTSNKNNVKTGSFDDIINVRHGEAKKSILVHIDSINSLDNCRIYCEKYGKIENICHYTIRNQENVMLIQFHSNYAVEELKQHTKHMSSNEHIPVHTTILTFRDHLSWRGSRRSTSQSTEIMKFGLSFPTPNIIKNNLYPIKSVADQMERLHNLLKLSELDVRLRFYTAYQLELCFSKLFPSLSVVPFGSSVNGFGQLGCDLDLVCILKNINRNNNASTRLIYKSKPYSYNARREQQEFLLMLSYIMEQFIPGICNIRKILQARVPIIKFTNKYTNMECDISGTNQFALAMSEMLFIYGSMDWRVKPLICTIRKWAQCNKITTDIAGPHITNFSLTLLILFYLQVKNILPPLNKLKNHAERLKAERGNQFILDTNSLHTSYKDMNMLPSLLYDFFEYYATFNFDTSGICIREGQIKKKLDNSPLYIYNPLEVSLNVSKNVNSTQLMRIIDRSRNALIIMDQHENHVILKLLGIAPLQYKAKEVENVAESSANINEADKSNKQNNEIIVKSEDYKLDDEKFLTEASLEEFNKMEKIIK